LKSSPSFGITWGVKNPFSGEYRETTKRFHRRSRLFAIAGTRAGFNRCGLPSSAAQAQAGTRLGSYSTCHGRGLAQGKQKHRWKTWAVVASLIVCAVVGIDVGQEVRLKADGALSGRECGGASFSLQARRSHPPDSGSLLHCTCHGGFGCRGGTTGQRPDLAAGRKVRFCRPRSSVRRHDGAGVANRLSKRTRDTAWFSPTLLEGISATGPKGGCRRRGNHPTSQDSAQVGQTVSFVRQAEKRERSPAEKDNRADTGLDPRSQWGGGDREAEHRPSAEVSLPEALADEAGGPDVDPADYAVDEHGSSSQGEDLACRHHAGACNRTQQSRQEGRVWTEVFGQSDRRRLCVWQAGSSQFRREKDAPGDTLQLPGGIWESGNAGMDKLRPRWMVGACSPEVSEGRDQEDRNRAERESRLAHCRGRPEESQERAREDGRKYRDIEEREIRLQQTEGAEVGNDSGRRAAIDGVAESEQADERFGDSQSASKNNRGLTRTPRISEEPLKKRRKNRDGRSKNPQLIQMELCDTL